MTDTVLNAAVFGIGCALAVVFVLLFLGRKNEHRNLEGKSLETRGDSLVFLVRDNRLIDANFAAHKFLEAFQPTAAGLPALRRAVHSIFDDAEALLSPRPDAQKVTATSRDKSMQAISERLGESIRLKLNATSTEGKAGEDIHRSAAQEAELDTLRKTTDAAPYLVWREARNGTPVWVNRSYLNTVKDVFGAERASQWPLPRLFKDKSSEPLHRISLFIDETEEVRWYECYSVPLGEDTLFTAFDANSIVKAETQLREFMQTLTKTFAELTVGLAVFDRDRNLRLFNPALKELTTLPTDFLACRPKLSEFLDRLRENRMMPEPRDYKEWRKSITELEAAAVNGSYSETWSLPGNLTYRVTGRPHPDGAIAFLFEDISAEITLTRQFRREIEIGQALLDNMEDATAHFSSNGALLQANKAYIALWSQNQGHTGEQPILEEIDVIKACRIWLSATEPTPVWGDVRDFVLDTGERSDWEATVRMQDGSELQCRFVPTSGGGSQAIFRRLSETSGRKNRLLEVVR